MKILTVTTDYEGFLKYVYGSDPTLAEKPYETQFQARARSRCGLADFYSRNLNALGHEAREIYANNEAMQKAWARENNASWGSDHRWRFRVRRRIVPHFRREKSTDWFLTILAAQLSYHRPDVLIVHAMQTIPTDFLAKLKTHTKLLVGQVASPVPPDTDWSCYDLVLSSLPNLVEHFRSRGIPAHYFRLGFEARILSAIGEPERDIPVSFVGSLTPIHIRRLELLTRIADKIGLGIWGEGPSWLDPAHPLQRHHRGAAVGLDMYQVLARSRITLNVHLDLAGKHANNMRLYEATGVGTLLLTDEKEDLHKLFAPGLEVATYSDAEDCIRKIEHYLSRETERAAVARAGQTRTLKDHTYADRMRELCEIIERHLALKGKRGERRAS